MGHAYNMLPSHHHKVTYSNSVSLFRLYENKVYIEELAMPMSCYPLIATR